MHYKTLQSNHDNKGIVMALRLELHGTGEMPDHVQKAGGRRHYNYQYNDIQNTREVSIGESRLSLDSIRRHVTH